VTNLIVEQEGKDDFIEKNKLQLDPSFFKQSSHENLPKKEFINFMNNM
jgi:hypothetical protein